MKPYLYLPPESVSSRGDADFLSWLMETAPWEERTSARLEAFWSSSPDPYTYGQGRGVRSYYPKPFPTPMLVRKAQLEQMLQREMHLCFLNRYDDAHQHLGWHADDSPEQDDDAPIVVQSYGAEREIWVRSKTGGEADKILLEHGSIFVMRPGMQQTHHHRIPKHPQPCGVRISLTWRALRGVGAATRPLELQCPH